MSYFPFSIGLSLPSLSLEVSLFQWPSTTGMSLKRIEAPNTVEYRNF